jgi:predicted Zn finger-like uncharacterized protein
MTVRCPQCATIVPFADGDVGPAGRMAQCRACGTRWLARVLEEDPYEHPSMQRLTSEAAAVDAVVIEHVGPGFERAKPITARDTVSDPRARDWRPVKIAASVLGALAAIIVLRSPIMAALPGSLPEDVANLEFQSVRSETVHLGGTSTLFVEGQIVNHSATDVPLPAVRITLRSPAGDPVSSWLVEPSVPGLAPGRSIGFRSALASPPPDAALVTLDLAAREGI